MTVCCWDCCCCCWFCARKILNRRRAILLNRHYILYYQLKWCARAKTVAQVAGRSKVRQQYTNNNVKCNNKTSFYYYFFSFVRWKLFSRFQAKRISKTMCLCIRHSGQRPQRFRWRDDGTVRITTIRQFCFRILFFFRRIVFFARFEYEHERSWRSWWQAMPKTTFATVFFSSHVLSLALVCVLRSVL